MIQRDLAATGETYREAFIASVDRRDTRGHAQLAGLIAAWSDGTSDARVRAWLRRIPSGATRVAAAASVALRRAFQGEKVSALGFLAFAEASMKSDPTSGGGELVEDDDTRLLLESLIPAWYRLGQKARAEKAYRAFARTWPFVPGGTIERGNETYAASHPYAVLRVAALAGRATWLGARVRPSSSRERTLMIDALAPGLFALYVSGDQPLFDRLMTALHEPILDVERVDTTGAWHDGLSYALVSRLIATSRAGAYVELALRYPNIISSHFLLAALREVEARDPPEAVRLAEAFLSDPSHVDVDWRTRLEPVALLAKHAPKRADAWAQRAEGKRLLAGLPLRANIYPPDRSERLAVLAALARTTDLRHAYLTSAVGSEDRIRIASLTPDRALARQVLLDIETREEKDTHHLASLTRLDVLGENAFVDRWLRKELRKARPTLRKKFTLGLAPELGRAAICLETLAALGPRGTPQLLARSERYLDGLTQTGQWALALELVEQLPKEDRASRMLPTLNEWADRRRFDAAYPPLRCLVPPAVLERGRCLATKRTLRGD